ILALLLSGCFCLSLAVSVHAGRDASLHPVVVIAEDGVADDGVQLRKGNGFSYPPRHETRLYRGAEARLRHGRGDWLQVELASGEVGWIPRWTALIDHS